MNEQQLTQVMDGIDEATTFAPGESHQLVPTRTLAAKALDARDTIIESAAKLAADMVAIYQERADAAQQRLANVREIADRLVATATKTAEEVTKLNQRDQRVGEAFARILAENGIAFEGEI